MSISRVYIGLCGILAHRAAFAVRDGRADIGHGKAGVGVAYDVVDSTPNTPHDPFWGGAAFFYFRLDLLPVRVTMSAVVGLCAR